MKAVIMAGGKGTRLAGLLKNIPKPMVPFVDRPLLEYQVDNLRDCGITDITLVVGHLGEVIREHFQDGRKYGVHIDYFVEEQPLGTGGALWYLRERLPDDFVLLFGDLFLNINFQRFYQYHLEKRAEITLYAHPNSHPFDSDLLIVDEGGRVRGCCGKNEERKTDYENLVNAGVYIISPKVLERIPEGEKADLEKQLISQRIQEGRVYAYRCTEYVKDIGTPERLEKAEEDYRRGICEVRNLKHKQKCIFFDRDGTLNRYVGLLWKPDQLELETGAEEAVRLVNESKYLAVVVTNQPAAARGACSLDELDAIHRRLHTLLGREGAYLDGLYYCPHHPDRGYEGEVKELKVTCNCRKPGIGMLTKAAEMYNIDLSQSWMIGDTTVDIMTGKNAKMKTALVLTGEGGKDGKYHVTADITGDSLLQCVKKILQEGRGNERGNH